MVKSAAAVIGKFSASWVILVRIAYYPEIL
jgi:hypothetical protein